MQDTWRQEVGRLISELPEVLDEDNVAEEDARQLGIEKIRNHIAKRWIALRTIGAKWFAKDREQALASTRECIQNLILLHGDALEFSPDADYHVSMPQVQTDSVVKLVEDEEVRSARSSGSSASTLPHKFMFLQTGGDVWTILQAGR